MNFKELQIKDVVKWAIIIFIIIIAIRFVYPQLKLLFNQLKKKSEQKTVEEVQEMVNEKKLSYPLAKYRLFADSLYTAMKGLGTDLTAVGNVFAQMKNTDDVYQLIATFGVRDDENLPQWIIGDLSSMEITGLNRRLVERNINYQF